MDSPRDFLAVTPIRYVSNLIHGEGGLYAAGRWQEKGVPILYTSDHPLTAVLELLVSISTAKLMAGRYAVIQLELPSESVYRVEEDELAPDWHSHPHPDSTRALGMTWLSEGAWLALDVPSAVFPLARNVVLNPRHVRMNDVKIGPAQPVRLDPRLTRST